MSSEQLGLWTLPEHRRCYHKVEYGLSCESLERLLYRAGGRCEICGRPRELNPKGILYIDHQHNRWNPRGQHGVRGMVCHLCNCQLRLLDRGYRPPNEAEERYLRNAWYLHEFGYEHPLCMIRPGWYDEQIAEQERRRRAAAREREARERREAKRRARKAERELQGQGA